MGEAARDFLLQISSSHNPLPIKQEKQQQQQQQQQREEPTTDEVELSLGLSLNGCFGVDPSKKTNLIRSSSIASFPSLVTSEHERPIPSSGLARTTSLPGEQIQVLKRLEAKRKRLERRNSINKNGGKGESSVERCDEDGEVKKRKVEGTSEIFNGSTGRFDFGSVVAGLKSSHGSSTSIDVLAGADMKPPQGEILRTRSNFIEQRSTESIEAPTNHQPPAALPTPSTRVSPTPDSIRRMTGRAHSFSVVERNMLQEMPCVSTTGEGPNGKRVEGFLYKYKKGDEVRIVCVCHGKFLTPAEFVRHAGGGDVAHPLRHIVVNASPSACV